MTKKLHPISLRPDYYSSHLSYLSDIATADVEHLLEKEKTYKGSWKKRGGIGAFMMMARKWDRLENILGDADPQYDVFAAIQENPSGVDGTVLAEVRDLRRYLLLVEAEMTAQKDLTDRTEWADKHEFAVTHKGATATLKDELFIPGTPDDGGHHAQQEDEA